MKPCWVWVMMLMLGGGVARAAEPAPRWNLPESREVKLGGALGEAYQRGVKRLGEDPYQSVEFLRSDVSFEMERWFTNYSGDISGRFLEAASMTSPQGTMAPAALGELIKTITNYQKADGHFGIDIDWTRPLEPGTTPKPRMLPIFWGNGRLLIGLLEVWRDFGEGRMLDSAKRLGDFYIATADVLMDPAREAQIQATGTYARGFVTCYFQGMEGLVRLYQATHEAKYLKQAERMAEFFKRYDKLPLEHSHGNLSVYHALMLLHGETGKEEYLDRAVARWEEAMKGGYIWPIGGVGEMFQLASKHDEGCSEADWLHLNLDLWEATGQTRYLDAAERLLLNHLAMNRTPNGGYGHHDFECDAQGPLLIQPKFVEAAWCCTFHGVTNMTNLKRYLIAGSERGVFINFALDAEAVVEAGKDHAKWRVTTQTEKAGDGEMRLRVSVEPAEGAKAQEARELPSVFVRLPRGTRATGHKLEAGRLVRLKSWGGYGGITFAPGTKVVLVQTYQYRPVLESRRLGPMDIPLDEGVHKLEGVVLRNGPYVMLAASAKAKPVIILLTAKGVDFEHQPYRWPALPTPDADGSITVRLAPGLNATDEQIREAAKTGETLKLADWEHVKKDGNVAFVFDAIAVPAEKLK